jgi:hypothetical protein
MPTRGRISWAELETGIAPTRGRISFAEFRVPATVTEVYGGGNPGGGVRLGMGVRFWPRPW